MKRVLVTGATGFIGSHCLTALTERGYETHAVYRRAPLIFENVHWHQADLLDSAARTRLLEEVQPTHLLHLGWYAVPGKFWTASENIKWLEASLHLVREFHRVGGKRLVTAGSCAEYEWGGDAPMSERVTPLRPATLYGSCKHALNLAVEAYANQAGFSAAWGRVFFLYGPHEHPDRLVASVIRSLLRGEEARCTEGRQVRDFMHVADAADAFVAVLDSDAEGAINIASGHAQKLRDLVNEIGSQLGRQDLIKLGAITARPGEPHIVAADTNRLNQEVGWRRQRDLIVGLDDTIAWWRKNLASDVN